MRAARPRHETAAEACVVERVRESGEREESRRGQRAGFLLQRGCLCFTLNICCFFWFTSVVVCLRMAEERRSLHCAPPEVGKRLHDTGSTNVMAAGVGHVRNLKWRECWMLLGGDNAQGGDEWVGEKHTSVPPFSLNRSTAQFEATKGSCVCACVCVERGQCHPRKKRVKGRLNPEKVSTTKRTPSESYHLVGLSMRHEDVVLARVLRQLLAPLIHHDRRTGDHHDAARRRRQRQRNVHRGHGTLREP